MFNPFKREDAPTEPKTPDLVSGIYQPGDYPFMLTSPTESDDIVLLHSSWYEEPVAAYPTAHQNEVRSSS